MKEIKAYIHRNRAADVVRALRLADLGHFAMVDVKQVLQSLGSSDQEYSMELGARVMTEVKLELVCKAERLEEAISLIKENAKTGQEDSGCIYVSDITSQHQI
ncbi:MAG: P-II family nitrogen regulator [Robiginitomaculum sp.]|nr:P-II family nitrogen regulator [Robiginitomaculum sp.]